MTVGENIQKYRKALGLSQEELEQRLLVSKQTVSLWEKDQAAPTIENLVRLKEVFGVSVDEILGTEKETQSTEAMPNEAYTFDFTKSELDELGRQQRKVFYKRPLILGLVLVLCFSSLIFLSAPEALVGFMGGVIFISMVSLIKGIHDYNKNWNETSGKVCESTYKYKIFDNYFIVNIYRKKEKVRESRCCFQDIERIYTLDSWLLIQFGGQLLIVRKNELKENSAFYSYMYKNQSKTVKVTSPNKWMLASNILMVASLLSIYGALFLVKIASERNNLFIENMWLFFLCTPIPIASIILGFVLKAKGYRYKRNVITGIIMTIVLCIYGSFLFML